MAEAYLIPRFRWLKRLGTLFLATVVLLVAAHAAVSWWFSRRADATEAAWQALPVIKREGTGGTWSDLNDPTNPAFHINRAIAALPLQPTQALHVWEEAVENRLPILNAQDVQVLQTTRQAGAPMFAEIAAGRKARVAGGRYEWALGPYSINTLLPNLNPMRDMTRYTTATLRLARHEGDLPMMLERSADTRELAIAADQYGGFVVCVLTAASIEYRNGQALREAAGYVPREVTAEEDAARWRESREPILRLARELMDPAPWDEMRSTAFDGEGIMSFDLRNPPAALGVPTRNVFTAPVLDRAAVELLERVMRLREVAIAGDPYPVAAAEMEAIGTPEAGSDLAGFIVDTPGEMFAFTADRTVLTLYRMRVSQLGAAVALAARVYEADHGSRPRSLEDLVPEYLPAVPVDPFDPAGGPLRLVEADGLLFLYSVGPDGVDNGGDPRDAQYGPVGPGQGNPPDYVMPLRWDGEGDPLTRLAETLK